MRGIGGGLLGGLLGGMLFSSLGFGGMGGGFGGSGVGVVEILLLLGLGYFIFKMVKRRRERREPCISDFMSTGGLSNGNLSFLWKRKQDTGR